MARIRTIKPEFFLHEGLAELSPIHRLFFIGLWTLADKDGRLEFRPRRIKAALFPWDDCDVTELAVDLAVVGLVQMYALDGQQFLAIPNFSKHQRPHPKETSAGIPPPPPDCPKPESREKKRQAITDSPGIPSSPARKGREGDLGEGKEILEPPKAAASPVSLESVGGLQEALTAAWQAEKGFAYHWRSLDEQKLRMLPHPHEEIVRRWRIALKAKFPFCRGIPDLVDQWNAYATEATPTGPPVPTPPPKRDPNRPLGVVKNEF